MVYWMVLSLFHTVHCGMGAWWSHAVVKVQPRCLLWGTDENLVLFGIVVLNFFHTALTSTTVHFMLHTLICFEVKPQWNEYLCIVYWRYSHIYGVKLLVFTWKKSYSYHKWKKSNCKVPMHAMKAHWRSGGRTALIPTPLLDWGEWSACALAVLPPGKETQLHIA
jgi:hypothetical protein